MDYLSNYTDTLKPPLSYLEFMINNCSEATQDCPKYINYFNAVSDYNKSHPDEPLALEPLSPGICNCIKEYAEYITTFKFFSPVYSSPPMSLSDYIAGGCTDPAPIGGDDCSSVGNNYYDIAVAAIEEYNLHPVTIAMIPPMPPYDPYMDCNCYLKYAIYLTGNGSPSSN